MVYVGILSTVALVLFGIGYSVLGYNMVFQEWLAQYLSDKAMKIHMKEEGELKGKRVWIPHSGRDSRANVYRPETDEILPGIIFAHGSDFVDSDADEWDEWCDAFAKEYNVVLFSISYMKIGVHSTPYPQNEIADCTQYFRTHADEYGFDRKNFIMMGFEAGAYLTLIAAAMLIQRGVIPQGHVYVNPFIDYAPVSFAKAGIHPEPVALITCGEEKGKKKGKWDEYADALALNQALVRWWNHPEAPSDLLWKKQITDPKEQELRRQLDTWLHERVSWFLR